MNALEGEWLPKRKSEDIRAQSLEQQNELVLPLTNPSMQSHLIMAAFPALSKQDAMNEWLKEDDVERSLASRFGAYRMDPTSEIKEVDVKDPEALAALLAQVKKHAPDTLH